MRYLILFVLIVAVLITAGCVSEKKVTVVEPVQTTALSAKTSPSTVQPSLNADNPKEVVVNSDPLKTIKDSELWFTMEGSGNLGSKN